MCNDHSGTQVTVKHPEKGLCRFDVDTCIAPLVEALFAAGIPAVASCCGHGHRPGNIALEDGREIVIAPDFDTARRIDDLFLVTSYGEPRERGMTDEWYWFIAWCQDCTPVLPQPFTSEVERDAWADAHRSGTGHTVTTSEETKAHTIGERENGEAES
ncbi:MAG: hypothetical protein GEU73_05030 [Chloroflexi bacterium]|nr:hypothetical protein [Chloroflexota bacterium]